MLDRAPSVVKTVGGLPIMYCDAFGYFVGEYPGEFDTLGAAESYARMLVGSGEAPPAPSSPLALMILFGLLMVL